MNKDMESLYDDIPDEDTLLQNDEIVQKQLSLLPAEQREFFTEMYHEFINAANFVEHLEEKVEELECQLEMQNMAFSLRKDSIDEAVEGGAFSYYTDLPKVVH